MGSVDGGIVTARLEDGADRWETDAIPPVPAATDGPCIVTRAAGAARSGPVVASWFCGASFVVDDLEPPEGPPVQPPVVVATAAPSDPFQQSVASSADGRLAVAVVTPDGATAGPLVSVRAG